jgi:hypothetical protein
VTFNEDFFDASLRHQIDLLRFGSGVAKRVNRLLDETRADLRKQVERRLGKVTGVTGASLRRLRELERAIVKLRSPAWNDVTEEWTRTALDVSLEEPLFVAGQLQSILPVELDLVQPSDATLRALVTTRPFQGRFLKEWADSTARADLTRIHQQIRIGMVQGESSRDIAARVFGDRGAMSITRHQVEAVTRTVINHVSNAAQQEFLKSNSDLFDLERIVATLDARTTPVCRSEDGKEYPVGKGPRPPFHVSCRTISVGVLDGEVIGERPFKAGTEQQMLREYGAANGLGKLVSRDDLPRGHKGAFDAFSRRRMRELTGQVPAKTTYQQWLSRQSPEIQDDILGPTRGKLFREGGLTLDRFVNREGDELTLEELRRRNRAAWERAGLGAPPAPRRVTPEPPPQAPPPKTAADFSGRIDVEPGVPASMRAAIESAVVQAAPRHLPRLTIADQLEGINGDYQPFSGELRVKTRRTPVGSALPEQPRPGLLWSMSNTGKTPEEAARLTTLHELGHHAHMQGVPRWSHRDPSFRTASAAQSAAALQVDQIVDDLFQARRGGPREYLTDYAGVAIQTPDEFRATEYFAEAHAAYHAYPDWLRRVAPRAYAAVEEVIRIRRKAGS